MIKFTYKQIVNKTIKLIRKLNKSKNIEDKKIIASITLKYGLHPLFFNTLFAGKNNRLASIVLTYMMSNMDIVKTLNYYYDNMGGGYNHVKYKAILQYIAIAYHSVAPTVPKYPRLYRVRK